MVEESSHRIGRFDNCSNRCRNCQNWQNPKWIPKKYLAILVRGFTLGVNSFLIVAKSYPLDGDRKLFPLNATHVPWERSDYSNSRQADKCSCTPATSRSPDPRGRDICSTALVGNCTRSSRSSARTASCRSCTSARRIRRSICSWLGSSTTDLAPWLGTNRWSSDLKDETTLSQLARCIREIRSCLGMGVPLPLLL